MRRSAKKRSALRVSALFLMPKTWTSMRQKGLMRRDGEHRYRPAWWLPDGHSQTIWGRFTRRRPSLPLRRETLRAPDGDELELHILDAPESAPRVLVLHGLEGTIRSHYLAPMFENAAARG